MANNEHREINIEFDTENTPDKTMLATMREKTQLYEVPVAEGKKEANAFYYMAKNTQ